MNLLKYILITIFFTGSIFFNGLLAVAVGPSHDSSIYALSSEDHTKWISFIASLDLGSSKNSLNLLEDQKTYIYIPSQIGNRSILVKIESSCLNSKVNEFSKELGEENQSIQVNAFSDYCRDDATKEIACNGTKISLALYKVKDQDDSKELQKVTVIPCELEILDN